MGRSPTVVVFNGAFPESQQYSIAAFLSNNNPPVSSRMAKNGRKRIEERLGCLIECTLVWSRILSMLLALLMRHTEELHCRIQVASAL